MVGNAIIAIDSLLLEWLFKMKEISYCKILCSRGSRVKSLWKIVSNQKEYCCKLAAKWSSCFSYWQLNWSFSKILGKKRDTRCWMENFALRQIPNSVFDRESEAQFEIFFESLDSKQSIAKQYCLILTQSILHKYHFVRWCASEKSRCQWMFFRRKVRFWINSFTACEVLNRNICSLLDFEMKF